MTAEGIEDPTILAKLKAMGDLKGQGYFYGRPETADAVRARLAAIGMLAEPEGAALVAEPEVGQRRTG